MRHIYARKMAVNPFVTRGCLKTSPKLNYRAFLLHQRCAFTCFLHVINGHEPKDSHKRWPVLSVEDQLWSNPLCSNNSCKSVTTTDCWPKCCRLESPSKVRALTLAIKGKQDSGPEAGRRRGERSPCVSAGPFLSGNQVIKSTRDPQVEK